MKTRYVFSSLLSIILLSIVAITITSCDEDNDNDNNNNNNTVEGVLLDQDKEALLFMLEEERLARDTYIFLYEKWSQNIFNNIKDSEQKHMDKISDLLDAYDVDYTILERGEFSHQNLQDYYDQFVISGSESIINALNIGATIEDLDIYDLQNFNDSTNNEYMIDIFEKLQCGSRNHIRSFVKNLNNENSEYTPIFLSQEEYDQIINGSNESCN